MGNISERLRSFQEEINSVCQIYGRDSKEINIIVVTKKHPVEDCYPVLKQGYHHLGENYVQEFLPKYTSIEESFDIKPIWHFIGTLQKNKVKYLIDKVDYIHSIDSLALAQEVSKRAARLNRIMPIFIQINETQELTKHGFSKTSFLELFPELIALPNISIMGLMSMSKLGATEHEIEDNFSMIQELNKTAQEELATLESTCHPFNLLSMGMSSDYKLAIKHGATHLRIGERIMGKR